MTFPTDDNSGHMTFPRPEYQGAPWVFDMNDAQRKANSEEMSANAAKLRAQAREINGRCGWDKFWLCIAYLGVFGLVFVVGLIVGVLFW